MEIVVVCISIFPYVGESSPFSVLPSLVGIVRGGGRRKEEDDTASASKRKKQQQQQKRGGGWHGIKEKRKDFLVYKDSCAQEGGRGREYS